MTSISPLSAALSPAHYDALITASYDADAHKIEIEWSLAADTEEIWSACGDRLAAALLAHCDLDPEVWEVAGGDLHAYEHALCETLSIRHRRTGCSRLEDLYASINETAAVIDDPGRLTPCDLRAEYDALPEETVIEVLTGRWRESESETDWSAQGWTVLYLPHAGRGGICDGADSVWTDASDADDVVRRYLTGRMVP